ncbi:MAG: RHS repeat-associated core domain-containing protein, partial [Chitinophagaceae bacterium]
MNSTTGSVVQRLDYNDLGSVTADTSAGYQPFGYAGGIYDAALKIVKFGARDYDPRSGRWMTKDPIGFDGGDSNLSAYCGNDPVNCADPSGLILPWVLGGIVGGVSGGVSAYIAGGDTKQVLAAAAIGAVAGASTVGLSAIVGGSAVGVIK